MQVVQVVLVVHIVRGERRSSSGKVELGRGARRSAFRADAGHVL